jgi:hypothetical protein
MAVQYASPKCALIRAVGCIQEELNLDKEDNIHVYALHPGGVLTGLQSASNLNLTDISRLLSGSQGKVPRVDCEMDGVVQAFRHQASCCGTDRCIPC